MTAGVREAHETVLAGGDQIESSRQEIDFARDARKKSRERLDKAVEGSMTEVFNSLQSLGSAQLHYLSGLCASTTRPRFACWCCSAIRRRRRRRRV